MGQYHCYYSNGLIASSLQIAEMGFDYSAGTLNGRLPVKQCSISHNEGYREAEIHPLQRGNDVWQRNLSSIFTPFQ
uniref:Uncharacterized protein n=1 Tax=Anguilla anguilla TaxID=7936 RepID=A0A0E9WF27_ANGAN